MHLPLVKSRTIWNLSHLSQYLQQNISTGDTVILGTDCNCSTKSTSRRQQAWKQFCEKFKLKLSAALHPTFHHHNGSSESTIDFFAHSKDLDLGELVQHCTLENPLNLSSHDPLLSTLSVKQEENSQSCGRFAGTYSNFERKRIVWDPSKFQEYEVLSERALSDAVHYWDTPEIIQCFCRLCLDS